MASAPPLAESREMFGVLEDKGEESGRADAMVGGHTGLQPRQRVAGRFQKTISLKGKTGKGCLRSMGGLWFDSWA
ncbi:hypothetical protein Nepgr_026021 [Nepenthes gracilis]|uniref:Uncharacterized protein n=1 Tax=Nepenthes gracilis TaxID=150966 RepID=A0AAD3Y078_NEPGR|nr:hypothetical protein Nepgr_026021 [Nepenthes gracilis]